MLVKTSIYLDTRVAEIMELGNPVPIKFYPDFFLWCPQFVHVYIQTVVITQCNLLLFGLYTPYTPYTHLTGFNLYTLNSIFFHINSTL